MNLKQAFLIVSVVSFALAAFGADIPFVSEVAFGLGFFAASFLVS